jgi:hypothetical protein
MEAVYAYAQDHNLEAQVWVIPKDAPVFWTPDHSHFVIRTLLNSGVNDQDAWSVDPEILGYLEKPISRLNMANAIVGRQEGHEWTKYSSGLEVLALGRVWAHPNFKPSSVLYPVGYISRRNLVRIAPDLAANWAKCEIQAVGVQPVFVVSSWEDPEIAFTDVTSTGAWLQFIRSLPSADKIEESMKQFKLTGDSLFGLTSASVAEALRSLAGMTLSSEDSGTEDADYHCMSFKSDSS